MYLQVNIPVSRKMELKLAPQGDKYEDKHNQYLEQGFLMHLMWEDKS